MMEVRTVSILAGRDSMSAVLEPLLGSETALERANNIAQVLVFCANHDPVRVALGMLERVGLANPHAVAEEVGRAWRRGVGEREAKA
jgi:hypothetical protein